MMPALSPITLRGSIVKLVPLDRAHAPALWQIGSDPKLWELQPRPISSLADMQSYVDTALEDHSKGLGLPWVIQRIDNSEIVGGTRFMDITLAHLRLEIGATWIKPTMQRSGINVESKYLQLCYAFESLGIERVVLKTELLNTTSQVAIQKLGAIKEGIFHHHMRTDAGRWRDMVYFAILLEQWPDAKTQLQARIERYPLQVSGT
jgi:N-acetyltransferase